jgi:tRNA modification GTPase
VRLDDTIVAVATPPGRGGIGVVRLSGARALECVRPLLKPGRSLEAARATYTVLRDPATQERLDEAVVTWFAKPHSYTTEDVIEISAHGSPVVLRRIVECCLAGGARLAQPGEFTLRAFLHGRLDLTQAEAVRDLIEAQTLYQAQAAAQQLEGALSRRLQPVKKELVELIATLEAGVDFAEDDVSVLPDADLRARIAKVQAPLEALASTFAYGKVVHDGITLAIVGRPNVGKSSLFNRLVERERAIVTATPGTTRDLVTETVSLGGLPVRLVDTAGLRPALDEAESLGIRKSYEALAEADLVLLVLEAGTEASGEEMDLVKRTEGRRRLMVRNKCDLGGRSSTKPGELRTSALTGEGIEGLREAILRQVRGEEGAPAEPGYLTSARHHGLVRESLAALARADQAAHDRIPHEMLLLDLYAALRPLDAITGETTTEDILEIIFGRFCIGK